MDNVLMNLQRFADEEPPVDDNINDDEKAADNGDNEPAEGEKKYTDAEVDEIVAKKFAKWKAKEEEAVRAAKEEAEKLAKMNAEQKQKYRLEQLEAENEKLKKEAAKIEMAKTATALLSEKDIIATPDMLEFVVTDEAETTKANIDKLVTIIQTQLERAEKERAKGTPPPAYSGDSDKEVTKEQFARMDYKEVRELKANNPELYKKLTED